MRSITVGIAVVILGSGGGCFSTRAGEYPEDCVREGAPAVSDVGVEAGGELDVKGTEQAKVPGGLERDPAWAAQKRETAAEAREAKRKAQLANRRRCPTV